MPLDTTKLDDIGAILEGLLGDAAKTNPFLKQLVEVLSLPEVAKVVTASVHNGYAEIAALFESARKMSPAARAALMRQLTPEGRVAVMQGDLQRVEEVELNQAEVDVAIGKLGPAILRAVVVAAMALV